ncbi:MAG: hypothetical protein WAU88_01445 [Candidatus Zixiibacteriota bacterium]
MNTFFFDANVSDDIRRQQLYNGQIFVYSPRPSTIALCDFARTMIEDVFRPLDPKTAQFELPVEKYAAILADFKPKFIHHPESKRLLQAVMKDLGCNLEQVYFDVPRIRTSTSDNYLTTGIAYAFHPHRDTWYSAPQFQINWWLPVYEIQPENCLAFHPKYWYTPLKNGSKVYNYAEWNKTSRQNAAQHIKTDTRIQPKPEEPVELDPQLRPICPPGGLILFSAAHLHSSVPNNSGYTRVSIDFRTVHLGDAEKGIGAPNIDSQCTGTTMGDYLRGSDLSHLPEEIIRKYDTPPHPTAG